MQLNTKLSNKTITAIGGEFWKSVCDYEGIYMVSNFGRVKSLNRNITYKNGAKHTISEHVLNEIKRPNGYLCVSLCRGGKVSITLIHRIVADSFLPNPTELPLVNHKDGNKNNNRLDNLEWCSYSQNNKHAYQSGLKKAKKGTENHLAKLNDNDVKNIKTLLYRGINMREISRKTGINYSTISGIKQGRRWKHVNI